MASPTLTACSIDPALAAAYLATTYWVVPATGPRIGLRCGKRSEPLDRLLDDAGVTAWAFVTACNPRSRLLDDAANAQRMRRLHDVVRDRGLRAIPGEGEASGDDRPWPAEPSLLVLGIDEADAAALATAFEQHAIVVGTRGDSPRLVWMNAE